MKLLIVIILALAAAAGIGLMSINDPGSMVVQYGGNQWELPLVLAVLLILVAFALAYLLFNFIFDLLRTPKKAKQWNQARQNKNAQNDTLSGYASLIQGDWAQGESALLKRLGHSKTPMLNYLGAAYAAQQQQKFDKRDEYLSMAEKADPKNRMAVDITRARMLTQAGDFDPANKLLKTMREHAPNNKTILRLSSELFQKTANMEGLEMILPKLAKTKALPAAQITALEVSVRASEMSSAVPDEQNKTVSSQYKNLSRKHKKNAQMAAMFAKKLIAEGDLDIAEGVISKAIKEDWSSELAGLYGQTRIENLRKQISLATTWLSDHEGDAMVHLTLARLNQAYQQDDKARKYYNQAIELGAGEEAFYELGKFYEEEGNHKTALSYYKKGVESAISNESLVLSDSGLSDSGLSDSRLSGSGLAASGDARAKVGTLAALESVVTPGMGENAVVVYEAEGNKK